MERRNCLPETSEMKFQKLKLGKIFLWTAMLMIAVNTVVLPLVMGAPADHKTNIKEPQAKGNISDNTTLIKLTGRIAKEESFTMSKNDKNFSIVSETEQTENQATPSSSGWRVPQKKKKQQRRRHQTIKTERFRSFSDLNNKSCCETVKKDNTISENLTSEYLYQNNETFSMLNITNLTNDLNESSVHKSKLSLSLNESSENNKHDDTSNTSLSVFITSVDINVIHNNSNLFSPSDSNDSIRDEIAAEFKKIGDDINFDSETETTSDVFVLETNVEVPETWNQQQFLLQRMNPDLEITIEFLHENNRSTEFGGLSNKDPSSERKDHDTSDDTFPSTWFHSGSKLNSSKPSVPEEGKISKTKMDFAVNSTVLPSIVKNFWGDKLLGMNEPNKNPHVEEDICRYWLECSGEQTLRQLAALEKLPSCPCFYSFSVHYNEQMWDNHHNNFFRWRDASGPHDQLAIYKPGARWCIRSLMSTTNFNIAAQHCCYDTNRQLITRGAGAGTPNFVSPEISREYHQQIDILPWILCKGDWTRYHLRRPPNNQNNCRKNPSDEEYNKQKKTATHF